MYPLKVLHVIWMAEIGGIGKVVYNLCSHQKSDNELEAAVLCGKAGGSLLNDFKTLGIDLYELGLNSGTDIRPSLFMKCKKIMSQYDIIHFHSFNPLLAAAAESTGKKIVYTEHGNFGLGRPMKIKDKIVQYLQRKFLNESISAITFNSRFTGKLSTERFGLQQINKQIIYNGIPNYLPKEIFNSKFRKESGELLIASIGRLARVKRFDRLIESVAKSITQNVRVIIMGEGPEENTLKQQVEKLNLTSKVFFPGIGNSRELISECDLCIFPSQGEAFGLVAIEAYQQGKQVVVFDDGGGITEIVKELEPESIVNTTEELSILIKDIATNKNKINDSQKIKSRIEYAGQFSIEKMASKIKALYTSI